MANGEVVLVAADGKREMINLTQSGYGDSSPKWVNGGKQMLWFTNRDGLRSFATSGRGESDVYSLFFTQEAFDKFNMSKEEYELMQEIEKASKKDDDKDDKDAKKDDKDKKKEEVKPLTFDWDGIVDRKERLTIHSSSLGDAVLSKDRKSVV